MNLNMEINGIATLKKNKKSNYIINKEEQLQDKTLLFGTGLATKKGVSLGFGVEFLSMVLTAIELQQKLGFKSIIHEIGTVGYNVDKNSSQMVLAQEKFIIDNLIRNLHLQERYRVVFSEDYHSTEEFKKIYEIVKEKLKVFDENSNFIDIKRYSEIQLAGMKYIYERYGARLKLGWINGKNVMKEEVDESDINLLINNHSLNEFYFDYLYRYVFPDDNYSFVYVGCGREFDSGNGVVPYTVDDTQNRPILNGKSIENFVNSINPSKSKSSIIKNWNTNIIEMFEKLFYQIPISDSVNNETLVLKKLDFIQREVLNLGKRKIINKSIQEDYER